MDGRTMIRTPVFVLASWTQSRRNIARRRIMDNRRGSTAVPSNPRTSKRTPYQYSTNSNGHTTPHTHTDQYGTRGQPEILRIPLSADNVHYDQPFANGFWVLQYSCYMRPRKGRGRISIQLWCEWSGIEEAVSVPPPSRCAPRAT